MCRCILSVISHGNSIRIPQWRRRLIFPTDGLKTYMPKNFCKTGGSNSYIHKNFYTKTTYSPLLSEKFEGSVAPPALTMLGHWYHFIAVFVIVTKPRK
ncbi:hypothetical protein Hanom_Chr07g00613481 [Helianthus anomalus]